MKLDVSWFVDAVDVSETGRDGEVGRNWGEGLVDGKDVLWLRVKGGVVNILIVNTILLTTCNADFLEFARQI